MTDTTPQKLIDLYQRMYELTRPKCDECRRPRSCCSLEYCVVASLTAKERGVELEQTGHPTLPFMGENGCIVPPHLRQMCTLHTCAISSIGFDRDPDWTEAYYKLRDEIDDEELKAYGIS